MIIFTKKIKKAGEVSLSEEKKFEIKSSILSEISREEKTSEAVRYSPFFIMVKKMQFAFHTATIALIVVATGLGGGILTVNASINSLPGDRLFVVKKITEQAQRTITFNEKDKTLLELELARKRLDELAKILEKNEPIEKTAYRTKEAVKELKNQVSNVSDKLNSLSASGGENSAELALAINQSAKSMEKDLETAAKRINYTIPKQDGRLEENLAEIQTSLQKNSEESLKTAVTSSSDKSPIEEEDLKQAVATRLVELEADSLKTETALNEINEQLDKATDKESGAYREIYEKISDITRAKKELNEELDRIGSLLEKNSVSEALAESLVAKAGLDEIKAVIADPQTFIALNSLPEAEGQDVLTAEKAPVVQPKAPLKPATESEEKQSPAPEEIKPKAPNMILSPIIDHRDLK